VFDAAHKLHEAGLSLSLTRESISLGLIYFHKFFKENDTDTDTFDPVLVSASCLFIAGKVMEQNDLRLRDLVNVFYALVNPDKKDDPLDNGVLFWSLKDAISSMELVILRVLRFQTVIDLPHRYLVQFVKVLAEYIDCPYDKKLQFNGVCAALLSDYFTSNDCLKHLEDPPTISIAVMQIGLQVCGLSGLLTSTRWEEAMKQNVNHDNLKTIRQDVVDIYVPFMEGTFMEGK